ncbi:hypothetical protein HYH03_005852 [Edaphochlamys debaryana]|uniref:Uncharacterized protein n=1 Tax=Edaphochlamys debaryana TaxID=47281 RepID=A0A835YBN5_9CHLO|nr:hypothetical protein HYH03_005852 [Edaphochlamys debaryana]|eukprot:KAG2495920.1 hypothetical protein HYH03_005852 [Edaphochlamys debaryana]
MGRSLTKVCAFFTHRVVRGLLIALGRPDGRLYSQTKSESWVLLGLLQAKVITSWGHQPEVVSVGHNPYHPPVVDTHLCLPTNRPRLLVEALEHGSGEAVDPNQLWARRRHMVTSKFPLHDRARELLTEMEDGAAEGAQAVARGASRALVRGRSGALASAEPSARGTPKVRSEASVRGGSAFGGVGGSTHGPAGTGGSAYGGVGGSMHGAPRGVGLMRASGNGDTSVRSGRALQAFGRSSTRRLVRASTWARLQGGACSAYSLLSGQDVLDMSPEATSALLGPASKHLVGGHLLYTIFKKAELRRMWDKLRVVRQLASRLSTKQISEPVAREAVAAVGSTLEDVLTKQSVMEQLLESRYLSLERLLSFMVMFHAMARRTADWWPLTFDISRSQSGLRVATTAAPVTASELEQSLAETLAGDVVEEAAQRGERERRDRLQAIMASHLRRRRPVVGSAPVME